jgi:hypothetical protein
VPVQATKVDIPATARAKFAQRQALHAESARKIAATVREMEIAGTGMRVKVPVEEVPPGTTQAFAARKGDGKGSTHKAEPAKKPERKGRKTDTPAERNAFVNSKEKSGEWVRDGMKSGKQTWRTKDRSRYYQKTIEKWEVEVYDSGGRHIGVIKPSDGKFHPELKVEGRTIKVK